MPISVWKASSQWPLLARLFNGRQSFWLSVSKNQPRMVEKVLKVAGIRRRHHLLAALWARVLGLHNLQRSLPTSTVPWIPESKLTFQSPWRWRHGSSSGIDLSFPEDKGCLFWMRRTKGTVVNYVFSYWFYLAQRVFTDAQQGRHCPSNSAGSKTQAYANDLNIQVGIQQSQIVTE